MLTWNPIVKNNTVFTLNWQDYAKWLMAVQGLDIFETLEKIEKLYKKQYGKDFQVVKAKEIKTFLEKEL